jgi:hypothetical protein
MVLGDYGDLGGLGVIRGLNHKSTFFALSVSQREGGALSYVQ